MNQLSRDRAILHFPGELASASHLYLMGGFAEDALLEQRITRERSDVDFLIDAEIWHDAREELGRLGILRLEPLVSGPDGEALVYASNEQGFAVEVWSARRHGDGFAIVLPAAEGFVRLSLPSDTFVSSKAQLEGLAVQTVSPMALALFRATSARTRGDAAKRAVDISVMGRLTREFLPRSSNTDRIVPNITELRA